MEQALQKRSEDRDSRMGGQETDDSGFLMEEDVEVELVSGFCIKVDSELSSAREVTIGSDEHPDREDWFVITGHTDALFNEQREESPGGDGGSQTQEEGETEADSGSMENGETEAEIEMDDRSEEMKEEEGSLDVCLWPVEENGGHVRISLEEVERYYRFSRRCHWLCGRCQMFQHFLSSFFVYISQNDSSLVPVFLSPHCICLPALFSCLS